MSEPREPPVEITPVRLALWLLAVVIWICLLPVYIPIWIYAWWTGRHIRVWMFTGRR